jgi:hypothetical protein
VASLEAGRMIDFRLSPEEIDRLLAVILQNTPIGDGTFAEIASETGIQLRDPQGIEVVVSVPFIEQRLDYGLPITELAAFVARNLGDLHTR